MINSLWRKKVSGFTFITLIFNFKTTCFVVDLIFAFIFKLSFENIFDS